MTLYLVHIWSSVVISFSVHPFHACSYMYLNHVFLLLLLLLLFLWLFCLRGCGGSLKASFWHLLSLQAGSCVWVHLRAHFGHSCLSHHWQPLMEKAMETPVQ